MRERGALRSQSIEVRQLQIVRPMLEHLLVRKLVEQDPHNLRMVARRLRSRLPQRRPRMRKRLPHRHPQHLHDAAERKRRKKHANAIANPQQPAILPPKLQQQQQNDRRPDHADQRDHAIVHVPRKQLLGPLDQVRRNHDHHNQLHPLVEPRPRQRFQHREDHQPQQQDVRDLRHADARQLVRYMHPHIGAAAQQVAVVHHQDHGRQTDALAEALEHPGWGPLDLSE